MATCKHCWRPLILKDGKCLRCGKGPNEQITPNDGGKNSASGLPPVRTFTINGVSFNMILVEGGTFWMGAQSYDPQGQNYDPEADSYEAPVHKVTLSSFYIGETLVTQALWKACRVSRSGRDNSDPWDCYGKGDDLPAYGITHSESESLISIINKQLGLEFRLPTEAEWEFAARGGNRTSYAKYAGNNNLDEVGWYWKNSGNRYLLGTESDWDVRKLMANHCRVHSVKNKKPNELGLYDMSGLVWECCQDREGRYEDKHQFDPWGPDNCDAEKHRVIRGGGWDELEKACRVTKRHFVHPYRWEDYRYYGPAIGVREVACLRLCLPC